MRKANRILVIDNRDSFVYNIVEYLRRISGVEVDVVREGQGLSQGLSQEKDDIAGIVLSPGAGIPQEYRLMTALLKDPRTAGIPVLGVCLGMQAMTVATGGRLLQLGGPKHGHRSELYFTSEQSCSGAAMRPGILEDVPDGSPIGRYHSWVVDEATLPECWDIAGRDEDGNIMVIVHRSRPWTGVQFHPESIITGYGFRMICNWVNGCTRV